MNPLVQISEVSVKVCFVGRPRQSIHPGGGIAFEREERHPQAVDADVVEECSEPLLLPLPCGLPYALQRLCHALPSLCPVRALLARVPLSPCPWLRRLRCGRDRFVRRLPSLLWQSLTSRDRASSATAPRLPDADRRQLPNGRSGDLPVPAPGRCAQAT